VDKRRHIRAMKILVFGIEGSGDRFKLTGKRLGFPPPLDNGCVASNVPSCPVIWITNFPVPEGLDGAE
jgi:hypothetical protein